MKAVPLLGDIREEELLGRSIASTTEERKARRGVIIPRVFLDERPALSLSVDRMDHAPRSAMARIAEDRECRREPPRSFRGWALVTAADASSAGRGVKVSPKDGNRYHSDICLNITERGPDNVLRRKKEHAQELASLSTWEAAPETG